jgi:type IV pilus assembly protein PilE
MRESAADNADKTIHGFVMPTRSSGFTLIELVIAVAIVSILAAIAFPSYQTYLRKSRRSDAESFMADVVAKEQQFLLDRRTYATSITDTTANGGLGLSVPSSVSTYYSFSSPNVTVVTSTIPPTFTLKLTPKGTQASDTCGWLQIDQFGNKSASGGSTCW